MNKKLLISFGTRPEWIKIKPLIRAIDKSISIKLLFTGQHVDLIDNIPENIDIIKLTIEENENRLDSIVTSILNKDYVFEDVFLVLVQGDTSSSFAVALAAFHRKIKIAHLEAGLRTYDKFQPYPEEFNRQSISRMADIHFCPTKLSYENLISEKTQGRIEITGNTVLDNLRDIKIKYNNKIIVTLHRRENHATIKQWFIEIDKLAKNNPNFEFIFPMHPNPNVRKYKNILKNVKVIEPLIYDDFIKILAECRLVITDSGGIQEESSFLNKKCIICREETERQEGVGTFSFLCESPNKISSLFDSLNKNYIPNSVCPYGDGYASEKIFKILKEEI